MIWWQAIGHGHVSTGGHVDLVAGHSMGTPAWAATSILWQAIGHGHVSMGGPCVDLVALGHPTHPPARPPAHGRARHNTRHQHAHQAGHLPTGRPASTPHTHGRAVRRSGGTRAPDTPTSTATGSGVGARPRPPRTRFGGGGQAGFSFAALPHSSRGHSPGAGAVHSSQNRQAMNGAESAKRGKTEGFLCMNE